MGGRGNRCGRATNGAQRSRSSFVFRPPSSVFRPASFVLCPRLAQRASCAIVDRGDGNHFFCARRAREGQRFLRKIVPHFGFAVAPAYDDGWARVMFKRGAQVHAVDCGDRTGAARRYIHFAVTHFDLVAKDMSVIIGTTVGARGKIHALLSKLEHLFCLGL